MPFLSTVSQPPASPIQFAFEVRLVTADLLPTLDSKITKNTISIHFLMYWVKNSN